MKNWKKYTLAVVVITVAGFAYIKNLHRNIPSDLRDAVGEQSALEQAGVSEVSVNTPELPQPKATETSGSSNSVWVYASGSFGMGKGDARQSVIARAKTDAQRNAVETVCGVTIHSKSQVDNGMLTDDRIDAVADGKVDKTEVIKTEWDEKDKTCVMMVRALVSCNGNISPAVIETKDVEWVTISGGKFAMGTDDFENAKPIHKVNIKTFDMSKTAVTVEQYAKCVIKGQCTMPDIGKYCNWGKPNRLLHPVNCVDWDQANQYAKFKGARLPSESEWEYAAKSGGKNQKYPWGNDKPTCDKAVMHGNDDYGCCEDRTMPVCSKTAGNTAQGLCDMAGNVWQWVQDSYQNSYEGAPVDGSAFETADYYRVTRGVLFGHDDAKNLRADSRYGAGTYYSLANIGFRLARSR